jgi:hypothetical protein
MRHTIEDKPGYVICIILLRTGSVRWVQRGESCDITFGLRWNNTEIPIGLSSMSEYH